MQCVPTGPEDSATADSCNDGLDNDCDGLIDCLDPGCDTFPACVPMVEDPGRIIFRPNGVDIFRVSGVIQDLGNPIDPRSEEVFIELVRGDGVTIFKASLIPGDLTSRGNPQRLKFVDWGARKGRGKRWGVRYFSMAYRERYNRWSFKFRVYADMSLATTPDMQVQLHVGSRGFFSEEAWRATRTGWLTQFRSLR